LREPASETCTASWGRFLRATVPPRATVLSNVMTTDPHSPHRVRTLARACADELSSAFSCAYIYSPHSPHIYGERETLAAFNPKRLHSLTPLRMSADRAECSVFVRKWHSDRYLRVRTDDADKSSSTADKRGFRAARSYPCSIARDPAGGKVCTARSAATQMVIRACNWRFWKLVRYMSQRLHGNRKGKVRRT
jgi:hypothetical protein